MCPQKIITRAKVPLKCNFANKSALFPQAAPCPFSILGRTLVVNVRIRHTDMLFVSEVDMMIMSFVSELDIIMFYVVCD